MPPKGPVVRDPRDSVGIIWLECSDCAGWDIYENAGIPGPYDPKTALKAKFICKHCRSSATIDKLLADFNKLSDKFKGVDIDKWSDVVRKLPIEIKANKDLIGKLSENNKTITDEITIVKDSLAKSATSPFTDCLSALQLRQASTEVAEVEIRKLSLVISGLPDKGNDIADFVEFCNYHHDISQPLQISDIESSF